jgi:hypothetical protein
MFPAMNQRRIGLSGLMREPCPGLGGAQSAVDDPPPPLRAVRREGADLTVVVAVVYGGSLCRAAALLSKRSVSPGLE